MPSRGLGDSADVLRLLDVVDRALRQQVVDAAEPIPQQAAENAALRPRSRAQVVVERRRLEATPATVPGRVDALVFG